MGVAYYPVPDYMKYDKEYFDKYVGYANTPIGDNITNFRCKFVMRHVNDVINLCDIGIGCGDFLTMITPKIPMSRGYDINPFGIEWLRQKRNYADPYLSKFDVMTFWDSLEHIPDFDLMIANCRKWLFISMPIYLNLHDDLLQSKHFRKDEHFWYFTHLGLTELMYTHGFMFVASSNKERELGREAITTFAFRRCSE